MADTTNVGSKDDPAFQEWVQTQQVTSSLDTMILDIRKYGFSFITVLITAQGFLLGEVQLNHISVLGIFLALLILVYVLFTVDRMHEVFLRGAVLNAMRLEKTMGLELSRSISYWSEKGRTATWGVSAYAGFSVAAWILCMAGILRGPAGVQAVNEVIHANLKTSASAPWDASSIAASGISLLGLAVGLYKLYRYDHESKGSAAAFKRYTEEYGELLASRVPAR